MAVSDISTTIERVRDVITGFGRELSPIAVFRKKSSKSKQAALDSVFYNTVFAQKRVNNNDPLLVGIFSLQSHTYEEAENMLIEATRQPVLHSENVNSDEAFATYPEGAINKRYRVNGTYYKLGDSGRCFIWNGRAWIKSTHNHSEIMDMIEAEGAYIIAEDKKRAKQQEERQKAIAAKKRADKAKEYVETVVKVK